MADPTTIAAPLTAKDFQTDQEVRWCPGCGDYSILAQVQKIMPTLGIPRENIVIISGIGCKPFSVLYGYLWHALDPRPGNSHRKRPQSQPAGTERVDRNW